MKHVTIIIIIKFGYELTGYLKLPVMYNFNKKNFSPLHVHKFLYLGFYIINATWPCEGSQNN